MSDPGGREALRAFHYEFMAPLDDEPAGLGSKAVGKEVIGTLYGSPTEQALTAVVEAVQESGVVPYAAAGVVTASSLLGPVVATAQNFTHGVGLRVAQRLKHEAGAHLDHPDPEDITFTWKTGDTVYGEAERHMGKMRVSLSTAEGEIEADSGIGPDRVNDIQVGTEGKIPVDPSIAVVIEGEGEAQTAAEHGETAAEIEGDNPSPNPNFVLVGARLKLKPQAVPEPTAEPSRPKPEVKHHVTPIEPRVEPQPKPVIKAAPRIITTTPLSKPKAPTVSIAAPKSKAATVPKKPRVTIAPQPGMGFGNSFQNDLSQSFLSVKGSVAKDSHHIKMNTIHGMVTTIGQVDKLLAQPAGGKHNKVAHHTKAAKNGGECSSTGHIFGKTKQQMAMNFFVVCEGYSTSQSAGVVGNLMQESSMQPKAIQNGGESQNPADAGSKGWGIAQWTPGSRANSVTKQYGIKGPVYTLQTQLVMVAEQLKHKSPTDQLDVAKDLKHTSSIDQAAEAMEGGFEEGNQVAESGGGQLSDRQKFAHEAFNGYRGTSWGAMAIHGIGSHRHRQYKVKHSGGSRHIPSSTEIYYEALKFDTDSYSETMEGGHQGLLRWEEDFPTMGPKTKIDCSGLPNIDVGIITHGKYDNVNNTLTILKDTTDWQREPEAAAGMGDLIEPVIGNKVGVHIEVVKDIEDHGEVINTFGAHTDEVPQPEQVGPAHYTYNPRDIFLRYIGPGAPLLPHSSTTHVAGHKHKPDKSRHNNSKFSIKSLIQAWNHPLSGNGF